GARSVIGLEDDARSVSALGLVAISTQGGDQPRLGEHAGMKLVREVPHTLRDVADLLSEPIELLPHAAGCLRPSFEHAECDRDGGQFLADVVVQLPSDPPALLLLRGHELAGEMTDFLRAFACRALRLLSADGSAEDLGEEPEARDHL